MPTDEEWLKLADLFGGVYQPPKLIDTTSGKSAYNALIAGGSSGFSVLLGGLRLIRSNPRFYGLGDYASYWSATQNSSDEAWYYNFNRYRGELSRANTKKTLGLSCRCVQDLII
ncbi:MAG: hypothetical protein IPH12_07220 [Saprospirales bacterium]|nr:hypothetical protein [Saprospirales bacterium]MBK8922644.1 hypothetical protein [Saprospirales bacterium]